MGIIEKEWKRRKKELNKQARHQRKIINKEMKKIFDPDEAYMNRIFFHGGQG